MLKKRSRILISMVTTLFLLFFFLEDAGAKEKNNRDTTYSTVTEVYDWGASISKVIIDLGTPVPKNSITQDTFKVSVKRNDSRKPNPFLEEGYRKVVKAYAGDQHGRPAVRGKFAVLELEVGPQLSIGSPLNYYGGSNDWIETDYTITQAKEIKANPGKKGTITGITAKKSNGDKKLLIEDFSTGFFQHGGKSLTYASFSPVKDSKRNPLIVWLHGGGEGGTDPTIPLAANKAVNFITKDIQSHFNGAHVLVPQTPTRWMDGLTGNADGTSKYTEALMELIQSHVKNNPDIDPSRIYIGGASNGGYMTMLMIRDYPNTFAAAFPVCQGLDNRYVSDEDIRRIANTPIWQIHALNDLTLRPQNNSIPAHNRLLAAGAKNAVLTLFDDVRDTTGTYTRADGTPYQYDGHWSWIYVYNNEVKTTINGKTVSLMEWLAAQSRK
ncbi:prolyl oligopeptidase family serine peptidase [Metabacillus lacus]|uniref:prolyl oligopeptidase family serine peptidase n=1 Tax=Metabacillus lacus TaxID=1983721 RepID=UPI001FE77A92|nr:prolyl oligopeptidase family serine peptidase [Metabacillus lacus]